MSVHFIHQNKITACSVNFFFLLLFFFASELMACHSLKMFFFFYVFKWNTNIVFADVKPNSLVAAASLMWQQVATGSRPATGLNLQILFLNLNKPSGCQFSLNLNSFCISGLLVHVCARVCVCLRACLYLFQLGPKQRAVSLLIWDRAGMERSTLQYNTHTQ